MVRHLLIHGRVQGVGFRYHFSREAQILGITGWVRNRRNGAVEAMIAGTPQSVEALIAWSRVGPAAAEVERVEDGPAAGEFRDFSLLPTE